jgi:hypothetical protein
MSGSVTGNVPVGEWVIGLPANDERHVLLMRERPATEIVDSVIHDLMHQVDNGAVSPIFEPASRNQGYKRFSTIAKLEETTFDILMNGRSGYRAQFYLGLEVGRRFNRTLVDAMIPILEQAWKAEAIAVDAWPLAARSLTSAAAKVWAEKDISALGGQPTLDAKMWVANCVETGASVRGLHLFSNKPPTIEIKGAWVSEKSSDIWIPDGKRCRDELLRCFGFT